MRAYLSLCDSHVIGVSRTLALEEVSQLSFMQIQVWQPTQTIGCSWEAVVTSRESLLNQLRDARPISD